MGKGTLALGALGVAIGAFEHLTQKQQGGSSSGGGGGSSSPQASAPPSMPPPPPGASAGTPADASPTPPPPPPPGAAPPTGEALLLVRAMIAAANADHHVDEDERSRILEALGEADASAEDKEFVLRELESPVSMGRLAEEATTPELAGEVYLASLMAVDVDTEAERNYLRRLASRLGLEPERVRELEDLLEGEDPPTVA